MLCSISHLNECSMTHPENRWKTWIRWIKLSVYLSDKEMLTKLTYITDVSSKPTVESIINWKQNYDYFHYTQQNYLEK